MIVVEFISVLKFVILQMAGYHINNFRRWFINHLLVSLFKLLLDKQKNN